MRGEIKAVIFDVDNTLLATDEFVVRNIQNTIGRLKNTGVSFVEPSLEVLKSVQAKNLAFEDIFKELFVGHCAERELWEVVLENYREHAKNEKYCATTGALEAIKLLKNAGMVVGLVTNRVKMLAERLEQAGFNTADFAFMCVPPVPEFKKPHPRAFEEAINHLLSLGIRPEQTIMFGDHLDDYYSSFYQNIHFVAILRGQTPREEFLRAGILNNLIFDDLGSIENSLNNVVVVDRYKKSLNSTSALDGRHGAITYGLRHYFSEYALYRYRVRVEIEHLITLSEFFQGHVVRLISQEEKCKLRALYESFSEHNAFEILQYDHLGRNGIGPVEHDIKACEMWIREKLLENNLIDLAPFVHFFVTSEDINNIAYKLMIKNCFKDIFLPSVALIMNKLSALTEKYADSPVMGRTHLQPASPTTFGKIFGGYLVRLVRATERLCNIEFTGKLNGAMGNYNTFIAAFPDLDWVGYSKEFVGHFGLSCELWTDQRGTHVDVITALQVVQEVGNVIRDMAQDISIYAALGTMFLTKVDSHAGSSVMPHKINPWFAEVAEGNIKKANWLIGALSSELDVSRLQRDLSDHDLERSYGEAVGYVFVAIKHIDIAINLIRPDLTHAKEELLHNPQVVTEAIQTILRKYGCVDAYECIKKESRGKQTTLEDLRKFVVGLEVEERVKQEILTVMDPEQYTGLARSLALKALDFYREHCE